MGFPNKEKREVFIMKYIMYANSMLATLIEVHIINKQKKGEFLRDEICNP